MKLYEITDNYQLALTNIDQDDEAYHDTLEAIEGEIEEKSKNVAAYFLNLDSDIQQLKDAENKIKARRLIAEKQSKNLKDYLRFNMESCNIKKIECPEFKITLRKPSQIVEIEDPKLLNEEYITRKEVITPDKNSIKAELKAGNDVYGAKLITGIAGLIIK